MAGETIRDLALAASTWGTAQEEDFGPIEADEPAVEEWSTLSELRAAGLVSDDGKRTVLADRLLGNIEGRDNPDQYIGLFKKGLINADLQRTRKGNLFAQGQEAVLRQGTYEDFRDFKNWGYQEKAESPGVGEVLGSLWESAVNAGKFIGESNKYLYLGKDLDQEGILMGGEYLRESFRAPTTISKGLDRVLNKISGTEDTRLRAEYEYLRANQEIDDLTTGQTISTMAALVPWVDNETVAALHQAEQETVEAGLTPEQVAEAKAIGRGGGEFLNFFDQASNLATAGAGASLKLGEVTMRKVSHAGAKVATLNARKAVIETALDAAEQGKVGLAGEARGRYVRTLQKELAGVSDELAEAGEHLARLEERAVAGGMLQKTADNARAVLGRPTAAVGGMAKAAGEFIERSKFLGGVSNAASGFLGAAAVLGAGPAAPLLAAAAGLGAKGKLLREVGGLVKGLGTEFVRRRGTIPYWRRVAMSGAKAGDNSRLLKMAGGMERVAPALKVPGKLAEVVAKGTLAEAPINYLASGGGEGWLEESVAEALLFGVGGKVFGTVGHWAGLPVNADPGDFAAMRAADAHELKKTLSVSGQRNFEKMSARDRMTAGALAANSPDVVWDFVEGDTGFKGRYNEDANTIEINVNSSSPLAEVMTHEVGHYLTHKGIKGETIQQLTGPGGYLRGEDGSYLPEVQRFKEAYEKENGGGITDAQLALEFVAESLAPGLKRGVESGAMQRAVRRNPMARDFVLETAERLPFLERAMQRSGVLFDDKGRPIRGKGPVGVQADMPEHLMGLFDRLLYEQSGRGRDALNLKNEKAGKVKLTDKANRRFLEGAKALVKVDDQGNPLMSNNAPEFEDTATLKQRAAAGKVAKEFLDSAGIEPTLSGKPPIYVLNKAQAREVYRRIEGTGWLNSLQLAFLERSLRAVYEGNGDRFGTKYQATWTTEGQKKKALTEGIEPKVSIGVPYGISFSDKGNISVRVFHPESLDVNIAKATGTPLGKQLYGGDAAAIRRDVLKMVDNHRRAQLGEVDSDVNRQEFKGDYLPFLNAVFGDLGIEQKQNNPVARDKVLSGLRPAVRSWRVDHMNEMFDLGEAPFPASMDKLQKMLLPEGGNPQKGISEKSGQGEGIALSSLDADKRESPRELQKPRGETGPVSTRELVEVLSPERTPPTYGQVFVSEQKIRKEKSELKDWALRNGLHINARELADLKRGKEKGGGEEHFVYFDGDSVIKETRSDSWAGGASPSQYFQRWADIGKLWPALEPELLGVSGDSIIVRQRFIDGQVFIDAKSLDRAMVKQGWERVSPAKYRHIQTGAIIGDVRPGNVIRGRDGSVWPFDVIVEKLGTNEN